jgi:hypothetical protein
MVPEPRKSLAVARKISMLRPDIAAARRPCPAAAEPIRIRMYIREGHRQLDP